jgi:D-3-phosphoglycerate dehydrogenase
LEPPVASNPLLSMNNVVATYHTAGVTHEARHHAARMGAQQLCELFATANLPPRLVNPQAWPAFTERYRKRFR